MQVSKFRLLFVICIIGVNFYNSFAQNVIQKLNSQNKIDWTRHVIISSGGSKTLPESHTAVDRMNALEAAKSNAITNLGNALFEININAEQTVADFVKSKPGGGVPVRKELEKFTVTDSRAMSDMSVEMDIELPLNNGIMSILLPDVMGSGAFRLDTIPRSPLSLLPWPECRPVPSGVELLLPENGLLAYSGKPYSALIINAVMINLKPALMPKILDENGQEVYGVNYISKEAASKNGLVKYAGSVEDAKKCELAGSEPLIICAREYSGKNKTNIIVSQNDAVLVHAAAKSSNFLGQGKVIVVIGQKNL